MAKFIVLEGIEGVGKTTNLDFIERYIKSRNLELIRTREPGGTKVAEDIRKIFLNKYPEKILCKTELLLLYAGRVQHVHNVIKPALADNKWVLSDRFFAATIAYQGGGRQFDSEKLHAIHNWALGDFKPDLTIILQAPVEVALARIKVRGNLDRVEQERADFFARTQDRYLSLAKNDKSYKVINANQELELVQKDISKVLSEYIDSIK